MALFAVPQEFLPDDQLTELCGLSSASELHDVRSLTMSVDTSENSLGDLGARLPSLRQLRLDGSNIATLRDIGTGFRHLRVLWLARSSLRELEGFSAFGRLREAYLAFNDIADLSPLMGADRLQVLDLEANAIKDPGQVDYLVGCDELHALTLEENPICERDDYRAQVRGTLPQLAFLDDAPVAAEASASPLELARHLPLEPPSAAEAGCDAAAT